MFAIKEITGKHVLFIFLGFFGVMLAVNSVFLVAALTTFNGGEGGNAYQRGLRYNEVLEAAREQEKLGWSHRIETSMGGQVRISLADRNGAPIRGLALSGDIGRPVADKFTRQLAFRESKAGIYVAETGSLDAGNWVVSLAAARPGGKSEQIVYRVKERLWLKPNS